MTTEAANVQTLMKACQRGVAGKGPAIEAANNLLAECYGLLGKLAAENEALRKIISESATACGAAVSVECSIEFMSMLPAEIGSVVEDARKDAESSKRMLLDACAQIGSIGDALGLDMDADADTMIGTARDLLEGLNRIAKECPLGSPGFAIACEVLGELGVQQEAQP